MQAAKRGAFPYLDRKTLSPAPPPAPAAVPSAAAAASLHINSRIPLRPPLGALPSGPVSDSPDRSPVRLSTAAAPASVCTGGAVNGGVPTLAPTPVTPAAAAGSDSAITGSPGIDPDPGGLGPEVTPSRSPDTIRDLSGTCGESVVTVGRVLGDPPIWPSRKGLGELGLTGRIMPAAATAAAGWWPTPVADRR